MKNEYILTKCNCGGEVELIQSTPWNQDPSIHCTKCVGTWKYYTYSDILTVKEWNKLHGFIGE